MNILVDPVGNSGVAARHTAYPTRSLKPTVRLSRLRIERISKRDLYGGVARAQDTLDDGVAAVEAADDETRVVVVKRRSAAARPEDNGARWGSRRGIYLQVGIVIRDGIAG